jgi:hypothetical protein
VSADDLYAAFEQLFAAQRRLRGRDAKVVDGISLAQSRLLRVLARDGALPAGRPAARLGSVTIELTAAGWERAVQALEQHRRLFESALADLSPDELEAGVDVLRRCAKYLDSL